MATDPRVSTMSASRSTRPLARSISTSSAWAASSRSSWFDIRSSTSGGVAGACQPDDGVPVGRVMAERRTARRSASITCDSSAASSPRR